MVVVDFLLLSTFSFRFSLAICHQIFGDQIFYSFLQFLGRKRYNNTIASHNVIAKNVF